MEELGDCGRDLELGESGRRVWPRVGSMVARMQVRSVEPTKNEVEEAHHSI